jgi:hypothetical protein
MYGVLISREQPSVLARVDIATYCSCIDMPWIMLRLMLNHGSVLSRYLAILIILVVADVSAVAGELPRDRTKSPQHV